MNFEAFDRSYEYQPDQRPKMSPRYSSENTGKRGLTGRPVEAAYRCVSHEAHAQPAAVTLANDRQE